MTSVSSLSVASPFSRVTGINQGLHKTTPEAVLYLETLRDSLFPPRPLPTDIHSVICSDLRCPPIWQKLTQDSNFLEFNL